MKIPALIVGLWIGEPLCVHFVYRPLHHPASLCSAAHVLLVNRVAVYASGGTVAASLSSVLAPLQHCSNALLNVRLKNTTFHCCSLCHLSKQEIQERSEHKLVTPARTSTTTKFPTASKNSITGAAVAAAVRPAAAVVGAGAGRRRPAAAVRVGVVGAACPGVGAACPWVGAFRGAACPCRVVAACL